MAGAGGMGGSENNGGTAGMGGVIVGGAAGMVEVVADCQKTRFAGNRLAERCARKGSRVVIRAGFPIATGNA